MLLICVNFPFMESLSTVTLNQYPPPSSRFREEDERCVSLFVPMWIYIYRYIEKLHEVSISCHSIVNSRPSSTVHTNNNGSLNPRIRPTCTGYPQFRVNICKAHASLKRFMKQNQISEGRGPTTWSGRDRIEEGGGIRTRASILSKL